MKNKITITHLTRLCIYAMLTVVFASCQKFNEVKNEISNSIEEVQEKAIKKIDI